MKKINLVMAIIACLGICSSTVAEARGGCGARGFSGARFHAYKAPRPAPKVIKKTTVVHHYHHTPSSSSSVPTYAPMVPQHQQSQGSNLMADALVGMASGAAGAAIYEAVTKDKDDNKKEEQK